MKESFSRLSWQAGMIASRISGQLGLGLLASGSSGYWDGSAARPVLMDTNLSCLHQKR